jgi:cysteine desulfurase
MIKAVYLDHHATTPMDERVFQAMRPWLAEGHGNPSSGHHLGIAAAEAVENARELIADLLGVAEQSEIVFTSGATESNHMAIVGTALQARRDRGARHVVISAIEHKSVFAAAQFLAEHHDFDLTVIEVDATGRVAPEAVAAALRPDTAIVSIMSSNNEIGTIQPSAEIASAAHARGVPFHCDATQSLGWTPVLADEVGADLISFSSHKIYGPMGIGGLWVKRNLPIAALMPGGGQQRGLRGGTLNVTGIVGLGEACRLLNTCRDRDAAHVTALRDRLQKTLLDTFPDAIVNGDQENRLPNNLNISVPGLTADMLVAATPDVIVSTQSACSNGSDSHVLNAIGQKMSEETLRIGLGRTTTAKDVDYAATRLVDAIKEARIRPHQYVA